MEFFPDFLLFSRDFDENRFRRYKKDNNCAFCGNSEGKATVLVVA
jgi:hypothetical protein